MAVLTAEIQARFTEVQREMKRTAKEAARLEREMKRAGAAAKVMDISLDRVGDAAEGAAAGLTNVNRRMGKTSQIAFQAGQAMSDFAVSGILGAANNIEFLAVQLGASGPLIAGISALSVAALIFRDDIESALSPLSSLIDETSESLDGLLKVIGGEDRNLILFEERLPAALEEQRKIVSDLRKEIDASSKALFRFDKALLGTFLADKFRTPFVPLTELEEKLGRAEGALESLESQFDDVAKAERGFSEGLKNTQIALDNQIVATQRAALIELGFEKELRSISDEQIALAVKRGELEDLIAELKEKQTKSSREQKTELQKAEELNKRLKEQLDALRNVDTSRLGSILDQNQALRDQIVIVKRLNEERRKRGGVLGEDLEGVSGAGLDQGERQPLGDLIEQINKARRRRGRQEIQPGQLRQPGSAEDADAAIQEQLDALQGIEDGTNRTAEAFRKAGITAEEFYFSTATGARDLLNGVAVLGGGISEVFREAYEASNESQRGFFIGFKAFAIAEATISTFVAANEALKSGPILGPILAAGIVAKGLANVARIRNIQPGSGGGASGGASAQAAGSGIIDPRQGRDGRFRRDTSQFQSGFNPALPGFINDQGFFEFRILGEDLVAVSDKNQRRQSRTRGESPARQLVQIRTNR